MTDIFEGELFDLLQFSSFSDDVDAQCFSWALKRGLTFVLERLVRIQTHSDIDAQPEQTIDALAEEFRAPYYDQALPLDVKKRLVKAAIVWHYQAGTPSAVKELLSVMFGQGRVIENWEFTEPPYGPYLFDLETNAQLTPDIMERLAVMLYRVKNVRSHLRRLWIRREAHQTEYIGSAVVSSDRLPLFGAPQRSALLTGSLYLAAGLVPEARSSIDNIRAPASRELRETLHIGAALQPESRAAITNESKRRHELHEAIRAALGIDGAARFSMSGSAPRPPRPVRQPVIIASGIAPRSVRTGLQNAHHRARQHTSVCAIGTAVVSAARRCILGRSAMQAAGGAAAADTPRYGFAVQPAARVTIRIGG